MNLSKKIKKIPYKSYYYVPPCPLCQSPATGYFVKLRRDTDTEWQINEALRHGELVEPVAELTDINCFCSNCGLEFIAPVTSKFLSQEEIEAEKTKRNTRKILSSRINDEKEERKKQKFKFIRNFIGKI